MRPIDIAKRLCPHAKKEYLQALEQGDALFIKYGVTTKARLSQFLAQIFYESGGLTIEYESGAYSATRLVEIFGPGHHHPPIEPAEAATLAYHPEAIFERVYGLGSPDKARELGNTRAGDGYRFRGTGLMQTTGGDNVKRMSEKTGVDFYNHPELLVDPRYALLPALIEWDEDKLNPYADRGDILSISKAINFGSVNHAGTPNGYTGRVEQLREIESILTSVELNPDATPALAVAETPKTIPPVVRTKNAAAVATAAVGTGAAATAAQQNVPSLTVVGIIVVTIAIAVVVWYFIHRGESK